MRFQCRSVNKTLGISVYELARRKLQWVEYEFDYGRNQSSNNFNKLSDKERFEKNRRRRLLKEQESKMKEEDAKSSKNPKCSLCKEDLIPPLKVYICQEGHLHREGQGRKPNKKICSVCSAPSNCRLLFMRSLELEKL
eukprot:GFUD01003760.1.p1 GENE.GFUD01003760.1~~GFUD01003760.1.p1  ORF type:complete len:138 (+),score=35.87 GFUD01003760.1:224-637(+)